MEILIMKKWGDVPGYKKILDEMNADIPNMEKIYHEEIKSSKSEWSKGYELRLKYWKDRLFSFAQDYMKEHPEEFNEDGSFKD